MLRRFGPSLRAQSFKRSFHQSQLAPCLPRSSQHPVLLASALALTSSAILWYSTNNAYNDSSPASPAPLDRTVLPVSTEGDHLGERLSTVIWGTNKNKIISPSPEVSSVRVPSIADWLQDVALRDLVAHERHAACIDARGDVYQWGDGFFGTSDTSERKPTLTLRGKNIMQLQLSASKIFALSASGKVYVSSTTSAKQALAPGKPTPSSSPWWGTGWLWGEDANVDFAEVTPNVALSRGERFVSISAGSDHVLALTSKSRTFAHAITRNANLHGQLALRKIDVPNPTSPSARLPANKRLELELTPKAVADPFARSTPLARREPQSAGESVSQEGGGVPSTVDDDDIHFCDTLFEIPSLRGVKIAQVATGARTSFARTEDGRVLGWGANEYGQVGLGSRVRLDAITVPTEVVLGPPGTRCMNVYAGGDLTCFAVERGSESSPTMVDLLFCGNGQWGGLGNNTFSSAQGDPIRAKAVSGLLEYSELSKSLEVILPHDVSISPVGHVLLTLDTLARSGAGTGGRDLLVWGANYDYQLGSGKRGSVAAPTTLQRPDGSRFMLMQKRADVVKDLKGSVWRTGVNVEQRAVALHGGSLVYWKIG